MGWGLAPKGRSDAGSYHNVASDVVDLVRGIRLSNKDLPVHAVYKSAQEMAAKFGMNKPSKTQVRRICNDIDPLAILIADQQDNKFQYNFPFTYPRQHNGVEYQIDHNRMDEMVRGRAPARISGRKWRGPSIADPRLWRLPLPACQHSSSATTNLMGPAGQSRNS